MVLTQYKVLEGAGEALQIQPWGDLGGEPGGRIPRQSREQPLIHGVEKAFDATAATRLADLGKDRLDLQVRTDLCEMLGGKIRAMVGNMWPDMLCGLVAA